MWKHWTCNKKFTSVGRSGHFCYTDNNNELVVEGGLTNHDISYPDESLPENARLSPATCLVNGVLFLFGGSGKCQPENTDFVNSKLFMKKAVVGGKWKVQGGFSKISFFG